MASIITTNPWDDERIMLENPLRLILVALLVLGVGACGAKTTIDGDILSTVASPNSTVLALVTRSGGNATVAWVSHVYLRGTGEAQAWELLRADKVQNLSVSWMSEEKLAIVMKCGRVLSFQNFYDVLDENGKLQKRITVMLDSGGLCSN